MKWVRNRTIWLRRATALGITVSSAINNVLSRLRVETSKISIEPCQRTAVESIHALNDMLREAGRSLAIVYLSNPNHVRPDIWAGMQRRTNYGSRTWSPPRSIRASVSSMPVPPSNDATSRAAPNAARCFSIPIPTTAVTATRSSRAKR